MDELTLVNGAHSKNTVEVLYQPINLEILINSCLRRRFTPASFKLLFIQFDTKYNVSIDEFITVVSNFATSLENEFLYEYIYEIVIMSHGSNAKIGLSSVFSRLSDTNQLFQVQFLNGIVNNMTYLKRLVTQIFDSYDKENNGIGQSSYNEFFVNLNQFISSADTAQIDLIKEIIYFLGVLIETIISLSKYPNNKIKDKHDTKHLKANKDLFMIPKEFIEHIYEFINKLSQSNKELSYLCTYLEDLIKKYFKHLNHISSLSYAGSSHNAFKALKLIWLNNVIMNMRINEEFFLLTFEYFLKNELKILNIRSDGDDMKLLINNLIDTSMEMYCVSIVNRSPLQILNKWKLFIEKQLPLLILRIKEKRECLLGEGENMEKMDLEDLKSDEELEKSISLSKTSRTSPFSKSIQGAIVESISYLDSKIVKILKLFANDDRQNKNDLITNPEATRAVIDYLKILEKSEKVDIFASLPPTIVDSRQSFLRSCVALNLITTEDFASCLRDDVKSEMVILNTTDVAKDPQSGEFIYDLTKHINDIFLSKNPEFDAVDASALTRFLYHIPSFEATTQYQISLTLLNTLKSLISDKKDLYLRRLSLSLLLNLESLDIIIYFLSPIRFVEPILNYLDNMKEADDGEEDLNFQDTFTDFGCMFLFLFAIIKRYGVNLEDILEIKSQDNSFCLYFLSKSGNKKDTGVENYHQDKTHLNLGQELINNWISELFYSSSGISDELISQSSAKQCFRLIPVIFQQAFLAYKQGLIDFEIFKNGVEYFFQPFLLAPLLDIFNWLDSLIWSLTPIRDENDKKDFQLILNVLSYLLFPVVNEEAKVIHGLILQFVAPKLLKSISTVEQIYNSDTVLRNRLGGQIILSPRIFELLKQKINQNSYSFNLSLIVSNNLFTSNDLRLHFDIKLSNNESNTHANSNSVSQNPEPFNESPFSLLEEQINSLVLWSYYSHQSSGTPKFDPYLIHLAVMTASGKEVINFFISMIIAYEKILRDLYVSSTNTDSKEGLSNSINTQSRNFAVEQLKKKILGRKKGQSLTNQNIHEIICALVDVLATHIASYCDTSDRERVIYWQNNLSIASAGEESTVVDNTDIKNEKDDSSSPEAKMIQQKNTEVIKPLNNCSHKGKRSFESSQDELFIALKQIQKELDAGQSKSTGEVKRRRQVTDNGESRKKTRTVKLLIDGVQNQLSQFTYSSKLN
ncbi:Nut1 protein [Saccharomycopsis crataegensis]|uniref:Mediator of RNA polymerase II transcription subunit 5 n=1 Tax=Saccharomycopsis crataegensis TaxID=43959 RepID=A0AAV5QNG9_9ASCO|nr:Nut1 protein [Saccharomycopsis crataegensis]